MPKIYRLLSWYVGWVCGSRKLKGLKTLHDEKFGSSDALWGAHYDFDANGSSLLVVGRQVLFTKNFYVKRNYKNHSGLGRGGVGDGDEVGEGQPE